MIYIHIYIYYHIYHIFVASWVVSCYLPPTKTRKIHWTTFAEVPLIYMIVTRHWEALKVKGRDYARTLGLVCGLHFVLHIIVLYVIRHVFWWTHVQMVGNKKITRWWQLKYFWNVHPDPLGKFAPFDFRIFFKWVGSTSQKDDSLWLFRWWFFRPVSFLSWPCFASKFGWRLSSWLVGKTN